jgi:hypothetical protein
MSLQEEFIPEYNKLRIYLPDSLVGTVIAGCGDAFGYWSFQPRVHAAFLAYLADMFGAGATRPSPAGLYNIKNTILIFLLFVHGTYIIEISATAATAADIPYVASAAYAAIRDGSRSYSFFG